MNEPMPNEEFDYEKVPTYGFGRREGTQVNLLYEILVAFAEAQDVALPELLGLMDITKVLLIDDMVQTDPDPEDLENLEDLDFGS